MAKRGHHGDKRMMQTEAQEKQEGNDNGKNHRGDKGEVPGDQIDWDLKEIPGEGYRQDGRFLDPGDRALETFTR